MTTLASGTTISSIENRFRRLVTEWKERSRYLSNSAQMAMLPSYQRIIGMGVAAVPLLLEELRREPDHWFWALEAITEETPGSPDAAGKVPLMAVGDNPNAISSIHSSSNSGRRRLMSSRYLLIPFLVVAALAGSLTVLAAPLPPRAPLGM